MVGRRPAGLVLASAWFVAGLAQVLDVTVGDAGNFSVSHNGRQWLTGGDVRVGDLLSHDGSLLVVGRSQQTGKDAIGEYQSWNFQWASKLAPGTVVIATSLRSYPAIKGVLIFEQYFPADVDLRAYQASQTEKSRGAAATMFPIFKRNPGPIDGLPCFSYQAYFPRMESCTVSSYAESHQGGAPLVIYNATDASLPMLVFSPLDFPKAQHMASSKAELGVGVKATVELIPAGWRQTSILTAGKGINDGMMTWGDFVLQWTGKRRADMYADDLVAGIGFWTDNGGYYHYSTGRDRNKSYEEVLPRVKEYHDALGVPFRHWQFDSWFYPKDSAVSAGGGGGGVTNWTALESVFPHGMAHIQSKIQLPMAMHNRQWSPISDYVKQGKFEWYLSEKAAVPKDPLGFFTWFFQQQPGWGLKMYEQDWMCSEYDAVKELQTNITMGDLWLRGMAEGAASSGRVVQYCMPYTYDVLSAASYPAVTTARASDDYFHGFQPQWAIGGTAMYYWAIGILPFKDGFYSSSERQVGGQTQGPEKNPDREAIMAALSCAIVGPMDGIHLLNVSRVMSTCRKDGTVLKPDRPVTTSDWCFRSAKPEKCYVFHTVSELASGVEMHYLYMDDPLPLSPEMLHLPQNASGSGFMVYNWYTGELLGMRPGMQLAAGYEGHVYAIVTPLLQGSWAFIGEVNKYVSGSRLRFPALRAEPLRAGTQLRATVRGVAGEGVKVCAAETLHGGAKVHCQVATFSEEGSQDLVFKPSVAGSGGAEALLRQRPEQLMV